MKQVSADRLLEMIITWKGDQNTWHHHYFTPRCCFNDTDEFRIIIENESQKTAFYTAFKKPPMKLLKTIEGLFFN